jgi:Plants and Prokaryotes Conserved (PCC) domain
LIRELSAVVFELTGRDRRLDRGHGRPGMSARVSLGTPAALPLSHPAVELPKTEPLPLERDDKLAGCGRSPCGCIPAPTSNASCWRSPPANASGRLGADLRGEPVAGQAAARRGGRAWHLALTGTLSQDGNHLNLAVADYHGHTVGGHLDEGCTVRTTAEVVVAADDRLLFGREHDPATGYNELVVREPDP